MVQLFSTHARQEAGESVTSDLCERFNAGRQTRNLAGSRFLVKNAFCYAAHDFRLGALESFTSCRFVASSNRFFHFANKGADTANAGLVDHAATFVLANAFLGLY